MADVEIKSENAISMHEIKQELEKIKKRDKELGLRSKKTEEYLIPFTDFKKADELAEKLEKLKIPRLKDVHIKKIVDLLPTTAKDLKVILQGYILTVSNENMKKIADTVDGFIEKK